MNIIDQWISDIWTVDIHNDYLTTLVGNGVMGWLLIVIRLSQVIPPYVSHQQVFGWRYQHMFCIFWLRNGLTSLFTPAVFADRWRYHWSLYIVGSWICLLADSWIYWQSLTYIDNYDWHNVQKWSWHLTKMVFVEWGTPAKTNQFPRQFAITMMWGSPIL